MTDVEDEIFAVDEHPAPLGAVARAGTQMLYRYDFGDDWEHDIVAENVKSNGGDTTPAPPERGPVRPKIAAARMATKMSSESE